MWEQIKTAFASGIGLRELARNMGIPSGTILARASREGWTRQIEWAKSAVKPADAIVPAFTAATQTLQARADRHVERMAGITEKVLPHLEAMPPAEILGNARILERFDYVARRNYGLDDRPPPGGIFSVNVLADHSLVQFVKAPGGSVAPEN